MSKFKVIKTEIAGLMIIEPTVQIDNSNFLMEGCSGEELLELGIDAEFVYEERLKVPRGVLKGLHFQREELQGKFVRVISGAVLYVAVDLRPEALTYGASASVEMSAENQRMLWIPERFAHGFLTLEGNSEIVLNCTSQENLKSQEGIVWDDPIVCIDWEFERYDIDEKYLKVSDRDKRLPIFRSWNPKTLWNK